MQPEIAKGHLERAVQLSNRLDYLPVTRGGWLFWMKDNLGGFTPEKVQEMYEQANFIAHQAVEVDRFRKYISTQVPADIVHMLVVERYELFSIDLEEVYKSRSKESLEREKIEIRTLWMLSYGLLNPASENLTSAYEEYRALRSA